MHQTIKLAVVLTALFSMPAKATNVGSNLKQTDFREWRVGTCFGDTLWQNHGAQAPRAENTRDAYGVLAPTARAESGHETRNLLLRIAV